MSDVAEIVVWILTLNDFDVAADCSSTVNSKSKCLVSPAKEREKSLYKSSMFHME